VDPTTICCPNLTCPARRQVGKGNIRIHARPAQWWLCIQCPKTFTATKGTAFYRLRTPVDTVILLLTLLDDGWPRPAIV